MNARVLRIELRRSVAPWTGLVVLATGLVFLLLILGPGEGTADWTAQWTTMALTLRGLLYYTWPVAVGLGALQGLRDPRSRVSELMETVPRPAWQRVAVPAAASAVTLTSAFVLVAVTGGTRVLLGDTTYTPLGWLPIVLVAVLALVAGALLGMGVARALPSVLTPPLMAVAAFATTVLLQQFPAEKAWPTGNAPNLLAQLSPAVALPREELLTLASSVHLGQTLWLLGMLATGFALLAAVSVRARLLALAPVLAGAALALMILPAEPRDAYVVDEAAAEMVCDGPVCVTRMHRDRLAALAPHGEEALRVLREALGEKAPDAVREDTALRGNLEERKPSAETVLVDFDDPLLARARGERLTRVLVGQGLAPNCWPRSSSSSGFGSDVTAQSVAAGWALGGFRLMDWAGHYGFPGEREKAEAAWERLTALAPAERRAWVTGVHTTALACDMQDPRGVLTGEAS
ncbi:hypothetical protein [Streptomyces minutiscleroticus]|uniref:Uncharacterized protein n=1 Tax=Streptomyces minutiscleroticus TaxID=68238 RepID=A0A918NW74_9ACTN|nr:hypothetical protein [Streptomyces minutiscleroticus]GGY00964.1 hypothetical protein GCM10010358_63650 [Streptomyces minutiscleroticus]